MWKLARESGSLDLNSPYAYLLFAEHFSDTCLIAESDGKAVGFVVGFRPPSHADTLFVWQIAVDPAYRGRGIGVEMLTTLLDDLSDDLVHHGVRYLEATVTPSNEASEAMFRSLAEKLEAAFEEGVAPLFPEDVFPATGEGHEEERSIRIGPIERTASQDVPRSTAMAQ